MKTKNKDLVSVYNLNTKKGNEYNRMVEIKELNEEQKRGRIKMKPNTSNDDEHELERKSDIVFNAGRNEGVIEGFELGYAKALEWALALYEEYSCKKSWKRRIEIAKLSHSQPEVDSVDVPVQLRPTMKADTHIPKESK